MARSEHEDNSSRTVKRHVIRFLPMFIFRQFKCIVWLFIILVGFIILGEAWLSEHILSRARQELMALPDYDYVVEGRTLHEKEHFDEALVVIGAGLEDNALGEEVHEQLRALRVQVETDKNGWIRRIRNAGHGALTGSADTPEGLAAALITDFFVVGDIRDLVVQGKNWAMDEEVDELIIALSAIGVATTTAPLGDWLPAILKAAQRAGALSTAFVRTFRHICKLALETRDFSKVAAFGDALWGMAKQSSSYQTIRLLRYVDDAADAGRLTAFMARHPKQGAFALQVLDDDIINQIAKGAGTAAEEALLLSAAKKGSAGQEWLKKFAHLFLSRHSVLGLVKSGLKENLQQFIAKARSWIGFDVALLGLLIGFAYIVFQIRRLYKAWKCMRIDTIPVSRGGTVT